LSEGFEGDTTSAIGTERSRWKDNMKALLLGTAAILFGFILVGVANENLGISGAHAEDVAKCTASDHATDEGGTVSLTICEKGKPLPKDFETRFSDEAKQWMEQQNGHPSQPIAPTRSGGAKGMSVTTTFWQGADFYCGNGVDCGVYGSLPPFVAIELDWYRVAGVHVDDDWGACLQEYGCYFETNYHPASNHAGDWVEISSDYAFSVDGCRCDSETGTCYVW
jgi:hypothetical protein